jgi:hypothetical protein
LSPKGLNIPLNMSRRSSRAARIAAPPINKPGTSAASKIAAPAAIAPSVATLPTTPGPNTELDQSLACMKEAAKSFSIAVAVGRYKRCQVTAE